MSRYKFLNIILLFICILSTYSCDKSTDIVDTPTIDGSFYGILYSKTYIVFTDTTYYDTISNEFFLDISTNGGEIVINSSDLRLNDVSLQEVTEIDLLSAYYGNDKVYINHYDETKDRIYYLCLNRVNNKDSVYLDSYPPPGGGWSSNLIFKGYKN